MRTDYSIELERRFLIPWFVGAFLVALAPWLLDMADLMPRRMATVALALPVWFFHDLLEPFTGSDAPFLSIVLASVAYGVFFTLVLTVTDFIASFHTQDRIVRRGLLPSLLFLAYLILLFLTPTFEFP